MAKLEDVRLTEVVVAMRQRASFNPSPSDRDLTSRNTGLKRCKCIKYCTMLVSPPTNFRPVSSFGANLSVRRVQALVTEHQTSWLPGCRPGADSSANVSCCLVVRNSNRWEHGQAEEGPVDRSWYEERGAQISKQAFQTQAPHRVLLSFLQQICYSSSQRVFRDPGRVPR